MSQTGHYFQFPLCLLTNTSDDVFGVVIQYAVWSAGNAAMAKATYDELKELKRETGLKSETELTAHLGRECAGVDGGTVDGFRRGYQKAAGIIASMARFGNSPTVRVSTALVFEARDNAGISERELRLYCALLSCVGAKDYPVKVTRRVLAMRAQGLHTNVMVKEHPKAVLLTPRQVNYTLDRLHERKMFARCRANERETFYSTRMTAEQLTAAVIAKKTYRAKFKAERLKADNFVRDQIEAAKSRLTSHTVNGSNHPPRY